MKGLFLGLVMVALVGVAWADTGAWENEAALGASYRSGNTDRSMYTMNVKRERYSDENDWLNSFYGEHGETEGLQTEGLARAQSEYRFRFANPDYFASLFTQGVHDSIRGIRFRGQLGPNVGYYVVQSAFGSPQIHADGSFFVLYVFKACKCDMSAVQWHRWSRWFDSIPLDWWRRHRTQHPCEQWWSRWFGSIPLDSC